MCVCVWGGGDGLRGGRGVQSGDRGWGWEGEDVTEKAERCRL